MQRGTHKQLSGHTHTIKILRRARTCSSLRATGHEKYNFQGALFVAERRACALCDIAHGTMALLDGYLNTIAIAATELLDPLWTSSSHRILIERPYESGSRKVSRSNYETQYLGAVSARFLGERGQPPPFFA